MINLKIYVNKLKLEELKSNCEKCNHPIFRDRLLPSFTPNCVPVCYCPMLDLIHEPYYCIYPSEEERERIHKEEFLKFQSQKEIIDKWNYNYLKFISSLAS